MVKYKHFMLYVIMLSAVILSVIMLSVVYADCHLRWVSHIRTLYWVSFMPIATYGHIHRNFVIRVIMLSVVMLSVVAPFLRHEQV